jgi:Putative porin
MLNWSPDIGFANARRMYSHLLSEAITAIHYSYLRPPVIIGVLASFALFAAVTVHGADPSDPVLDLLLQKGIVTDAEVQKARADAERIRTNEFATLMPPVSSKWKIGNAIKNVELFGDLRVRYEYRQTVTPDDARLELDRYRYAARIGLRGEAYDDFYYGIRLDTASNPRSPWVTFGTSASGNTYNGPFGKSTAGINVGQIYLGWRPTEWFDFTIGQMPQPLYTTSMVWDSDLNPEGASERFNYKVGEASFFANFGQFYYQDINPTYSSGGLGFNGLAGQEGNPVFQIAWQLGMKYDINTNTSLKVGATLYEYLGLNRSTAKAQNVTSPYFGDPFVGEGTFLGPGTGTINGSSGFGTSGVLPGYESLGFPNNQVGLNHLKIIEIPFQANFKLVKLSAQVFGDFAYNLEGAERAEDAANAYAVYLANANPTPTISAFKAQRNDVKAYQAGMALASRDALGMVYGATARRGAIEARAYWQHVEQYALDPNLLDSDFFEGRANLEGIYMAVAYGLTDNVIATLRYGYAHRINDKLGTGGSNQDIPQINPIHQYNLIQLDLTLRF